MNALASIGRYRALGLVVLVVLLAVVPYTTSAYTTSLVSLILIAAMLATSVNFLAGQMALVSVGHAGIAATAGYGIAWASKNGWSVGGQLLLALVLTIVVTAIYGVTSMRTNGIFFLMVTLALGMVVWGLTYRMAQVTGGENGISGIRRPDVIAPYWSFYFAVLVLFVLASVALWVVSRSPYGLVLQGIKESESRMSSLGYQIPAYKFTAMMISGPVAGLAGVLWVWHAEFTSPTSAGFLRSALTVVMVILGGVGTLLGPLVGAAIVIWTEHVVSSHVERWPTVLGLIFVVVILFAPGGVVGGLRSLRTAWTRRRGGPPTDPPADPPSGSGSPSPSSRTTTTAG